MAENSLPLNPTTTFTHISVHMVHILARMMAKRAVTQELRDQGVRLTLVPPREINERATTYLRNYVEVWKEALAQAHRLDEAEGQRKDRLKLRREQLARLARSVSKTDSADGGTDIAGVFNTTSTIFRGSRLLNTF